MPLVVGLGNPGERYARTRHNVGWRVLDLLAHRWRAVPAAGPATVRALKAERDGREVFLLYPLTFMNASGEALAAWRADHALDSASLLVVADDVYLPVGTLRLRPRGSSGGHLGLESIEAALGSREYARLRIGVGHVEAEGLREHVLETFGADEEAVFSEVVTRAAEAVECWMLDGPTAAMNRFNRRWSKEVLEP